MRAFALAMLGLVGCYDCPSGQTRYEVHGSTSGGFVCIPAPEPAAAATATPTTATTATTRCAVTDAGTLDVMLAPSYSLPPAPHDTIAPDGTFVLAQAIRYSSSYVGPAFRLRGVLVKAGAKLTLGMLATETRLEANRSFTLSLTGSALAEVCETSHGTTAASTLFRGGPGSEETADLDWNETTHTLSLSIHAATGTIVLEFVT